jgi:uroporphyrinogen decarboxylase
LTISKDAIRRVFTLYISMLSQPALKNDLLIRAAHRQPTERTPVWMMRQAGRYLPEYRALRAEGEFFTVVRTPELATEVTLQPVQRFDLDAAIIFSDILVIPQAMGMEVEMVPGKGPHFPEPLEGPSSISRLRTEDLSERLGYVYEAITMTRLELGGKIPLIGFCGAPWTLMAYMIEGGGSRNFSKSKTWLYHYPAESQRLLQVITDALVEFLDGQIRAGAQVVQVFDTWAGLLGPDEFTAFAQPYLAQIGERLAEKHPKVPRILFAKGVHYAMEELATLGYNVLGLDWTMRPETVRRQVAGKLALQGNLDPCVLYAEPDVIRLEVRRMLTAFGPMGHIANLGHGMHPDHNPEHARVFIDAVHELSAQMR